MITTHAYEDHGHAQYDWLDTSHHFSFARYYDPKKMGFGALRVINDDRIKAGAGFEPHPTATWRSSPMSAKARLPTKTIRAIKAGRSPAMYR